MFDLIYNFILNTLLGNPENTQAQDCATLLTFASIILIYFCLVKLIVWVFHLGNGNSKKWRG